jgi:hypothetical protein
MTHDEELARLTDARPPAICCWCPTFDPTALANRGASHTICPTCAARVHAELDALEAGR